MSITLLESEQLKDLKSKLGTTMSSEQALKEATHYDGYCQRMPQRDPAYPRFARLRDGLFLFAVLLEKNGE